MITNKFVLVSIFLFFSKFCSRAISGVAASLTTSLTPTFNPVKPKTLAFGGQSTSLRPISRTTKAILHNNNGNVRSSDNYPNARELLTA